MCIEFDSEYCDGNSCGVGDGGSYSCVWINFGVGAKKDVPGMHVAFAWEMLAGMRAMSN